jgi:hypothetical protein
LVITEFHNQGKLEKAAGYPISPNMNASMEDQANIQLTFTQVIVQPIFEFYVDLFPKTLVLLDLINYNIRMWEGRVSAGINRNFENTSSQRHSSVGSEGSRRVSLPAGIVEIPDAKSKQQYRIQRGRCHSRVSGLDLSNCINCESSSVVDILEETEGGNKT